MGIWYGRHGKDGQALDRPAGPRYAPVRQARHGRARRARVWRARVRLGRNVRVSVGTARYACVAARSVLVCQVRLGTGGIGPDCLALVRCGWQAGLGSFSLGGPWFAVVRQARLGAPGLGLLGHGVVWFGRYGMVPRGIQCNGPHGFGSVWQVRFGQAWDALACQGAPGHGSVRQVW